MKINEAKIVISAASQKQYPKSDQPEIALAGRSNVGKSSFINRLIQRKNLARTSSKPGKTQTLNFYQLNDSFYFVDVPGYGYAKVSKTEREKWGVMMNEYFEQREQLRAVVLVTDLRHDPSKEDIQMYEYVKALGKPLIIIGTKMDKIPNSKLDRHIKQAKAHYVLDDHTHFVPFSAETGRGKDQAWGIIQSYF